MKKGRKEATWPAQVVARYGDQMAHTLQSLAEDEFDYYGRCKRASILWDWIGGTAMDDLEKRYSATPYQGRIGAGDVRRFADATRFHLRSAHQIFAVMFVGRGPTEESVETLLRQLEVGIPADSLGLLELPLPLSRGEYLALRAAGATCVDDFWKLPTETLAAILGKIRSAEMEKLRSTIRSEYRLRA